MSTVKIKTEPATTTTTAAAVDVQVKLESSLSTTSDIKLEQHTPDINTKVESDSEDYIKSEYDDGDDEDTDQYQFICKHPGCGCSFSYASHLRMHQYEHRLQAELTTHGKTYTLTRQSLNDRWSCPIPDCKSAPKTVAALGVHIRKIHANTIRQQQQQRPHKKMARYKYYIHDVDDLYVDDTRCGYYNIAGMFICYECGLVPECLLTHLQQKHGYDEKSIDSAFLPESARITGSDPNRNQHINNPHLAAAIREPNQPQHPDIVQGWLCDTSDCGYCYPTKRSMYLHQHMEHRDEQQSALPALVLRLFYAKAQSSYFLITRLDTTSNSVNSNCSTNQPNSECDDEDDGDELVLSDYSD